jgi:hypothetical protein
VSAFLIAICPVESDFCLLFVFCSQCALEKLQSMVRTRKSIFHTWLVVFRKGSWQRFNPKLLFEHCSFVAIDGMSN